VVLLGLNVVFFGALSGSPCCVTMARWLDAGGLW